MNALVGANVSTESADPRRSLGELVGVVAVAAEAYERPDLADRSRALRDKLARDEVRVVVAGEFKRGKSSLVNALVGADICLVDDDIATAVPMIVRHGAEASAEVLVDIAPDSQDERDESDDGPVVERIPVRLDELDRWVRDGVEDRPVRWAEVGIDSALLAGGLVLVDTPGVGGLDSAHGSATLSALASADAVLLVTDASQELTAAEVEFLRTAIELCPTAAVVTTKIDLYPAWRTIVHSDEELLERIGAGVPVFAVSSALCQMAATSGDDTLALESGFAALVHHLIGEVQADAARRAAQAGGESALETVRRLREPFVAEAEALDDPEAATRRLAALEAAEEAVAELRARGARWQVLLNDGTADLNSEVDHDLRERMRRVGREIDERVDDAQPTKQWDELAGWLGREAASEVSANHVLLLERSAALAAELVGLFRVGNVEPTLPELELADPFTLVDGLEIGAGDDDEVGSARRAGTALLAGAKGSYGYVMMLTMGAGMIGVTLAAPVMAGAALGLGRKAVKDERARKLTQERQQAKAVFRRHVDEVSFVAGKASRDALRTVQRTLRDGLGELADEVATQVQAELDAARRGAQQTDVQSRRDDVAAELRRLDALAARLAGVLDVRDETGAHP